VAEEEKNEETTEETPEPEAPEETPEPEAPEETPEPEAPAEEPVAEEAPAEEPDEAEPAEALSPKQLRKRERSIHTGETRPPQTVEERTAERLERRSKKAAERSRWRAKSREKRKAGGPREGTPPAERTAASNARERLGVVVSDKADKTITVRIDIARQHRTYGKIVRTSSTLHAHDEGNEASAGDTVRVVESRPLSKRKRWRLVEILERAR
jgi:small subunit ribosomal protein S17